MDDPLMPNGDLATSVDDKGRLKLPLAFRQAMAMQKEWFLSRHGDGKRLHLKATGDKDQRIEIDPSGRITIPAEVSANFKRKEMRLYWGNDQLVLMTSEEYEALKPAGISGQLPPTG